MFQNIIEVLILSAIQGISEFLPISSSAHLILVSTLYEFKSSSLLIDISLHLGSLIAIIYFFKDELFDIRKNKRILNLIVLGSIPLIIVGYILYSTKLIYQLRNLEVIAWTTLIFAIIFGYFIWDEIPTFKTLTGAFLVIVSTLIIFRREIYKKKIITSKTIND